MCMSGQSPPSRAGHLRAPSWFPFAPLQLLLLRGATVLAKNEYGAHPRAVASPNPLIAAVLHSAAAAPAKRGGSAGVQLPRGAPAGASRTRVC